MGTGNGVVAKHGAIVGTQWGGCGHWAGGVGGQGCLDLFGPIWVLLRVHTGCTGVHAGMVVGGHRHWDSGCTWGYGRHVVGWL